MGIRDLFVLTLQLFESDYFKTKSEKAKHKGNLPPASPKLGPPPTSQPCAHPDPAPPRREGVGGWGRAAHAQCRGPPPRLREVTLAHPGPRPPRQPLAAAGDRLPWPLRAAVFSGSWGASCCSRPRPFRAPWFGAPRPSPPLLRPAGCCRWGFCPRVQTCGPAGSAAVRRPQLGPRRGSGECSLPLSAVRAGLCPSPLLPAPWDSPLPPAPSSLPCPLGPSAALRVSRVSRSALSTVSQPQAPHPVPSLSSRAAGAGSQALFFACRQLCLLAAVSQSPPGSRSLPVFTSFSFFLEPKTPRAECEAGMSKVHLWVWYF